MGNLKKGLLSGKKVYKCFFRGVYKCYCIGCIGKKKFGLLEKSKIMSQNKKSKKIWEKRRRYLPKLSRGLVAPLKWEDCFLHSLKVTLRCLQQL